MLLTDAELKQITGREKPHAQIKALRALGINHKVNAAGRILVVADHAWQVIGGNVTPIGSKRKVEPLFENAR